MGLLHLIAYRLSLRDIRIRAGTQDKNLEVGTETETTEDMNLLDHFLWLALLPFL